MSVTSPDRRWWKIAGLVVGFLLLSGGVIAWLHFTPKAELRRHLILSTFYWLEATFALLLICAAMARRSLKEFVRAVNFATWLKLAALMLAAFCLAHYIAPRTNRIFYDEDIYEEQGVNLALLHRAQLCDEANIEFDRYNCAHGDYNKWPSGYPYLLALTYRSLGVNENHAFTLNNFNFALTVLMVFAVTLLLFGDKRAALLAALAMAAVPAFAAWSNTAAVEPTTAMTAAFAVFAWLLFVRKEKTSVLFLAVIATAFAMHFRMETILLPAAIALLLALLRPRTFVEMRFWAAALLGGVLLVPLAGHYIAVSDEPWGTVNQARFSLSYLKTNLAPNVLYYFNNREFPVVITLLALAGAGWVGAWRQRLIAGVWFLLFWGIFLFFYAGSYKYGADIRYSLVSYAPLTVLAGFGAHSLAEVVRRKWRGPVYLLIALLIAANWFYYLPTLRAKGELAWEARLDHEYAHELLDKLPANSLIFTHNPNMFILWGQSAAQMYMAAQADPDRLKYLQERYAGGLYLHWNYWCNVDDPQQVKFCNDAIERYDVEQLDETRWWRVRYGLYRLNGLKPPPLPPNTE